ncbi:MAG: hypothetical protein K0S25_396 [Bacillus sp. (in: firmicutes)]|jgi:hypothetical protein|nr:hypothetical protein [Bacillus sp. (in: firmicutes)]
MARKTDVERLLELEEKLEQLKARKQQIESRMKEKERKERTRRLIQVGAIFEKYFEIEDVDQAEKIAFGMREHVKKNKEKIMTMNLEKSK